MAAPTLDGTATGIKSSSGNATATLTTSNGNDVICVLAYVEVTSGNAPAVSAVTGSGLTFSKYTAAGGSGSSAPLNSMELWYAEATSALTSEILTVSWASGFDDAAILCFGVSGAYIASPWDNNASLPKTALHAPVAPWTPSFSGLSTAGSTDFLIFACGNSEGWTSIGTVPSGFTALGYINNTGGSSFAQLGAAYERTSSALNNATISWGSSQNTYGSGAAIFAALSATAPTVQYVDTNQPPIKALNMRQLPQQGQMLPRPKARFAPIVPPALALADSAVSSDAFTAAQLQNQSDSVASSDGFTFTFAASQTLFDLVVSYDQNYVPGVFEASFSDGASSSDLFSVQNSSTPQVKFAGLVRKTLGLYVPQANNFGAIPVFPTLPQGFPVKVSPVLDTVIGTTKSLREMRVAQQTYPIWDIEITFEQLKDQTQNQTPFAAFAGYTQFQQLVSLWLSMYGQTGVFAFDCFWDDSRSEQAIGVGDGLTYQFTVFATYGLGSQATLVPVGQINAIETVYVNGVAQAAGTYTFSRNKLLFINSYGVATPPAEGAIIALTFTFYYLCRWTEDEHDFEEYSKNRWTVPSLRFRASPWL